MPVDDSRTLERTRSLCPVCLETVDASYRGRGDTVWLEKNCPEHGEFAVPFWEGVSGFLEWRASQNPAQPPRNPQSRSVRGCPYDCGLCENHIQATCCVLLELTSRCDLGCPVCFASSGSGGPDPSLETVAFWYDRLMEQGGPFNIQLSGGEPSLRDDLPRIIRMGKKKGFVFFQLNTNGLRIARDREYLRELAGAGLNTVFLQFDSLAGDRCAALRGRDLVAEKIRAINNCAEAGLGVVLTPTIRRGVNDGGLWPILEFAAANMPVVRGVHFQPMSFFGRYQGDPVKDRFTIPALLKGIEEQSGGRLRARDFLPGGAEHPLCSFHANYTVAGGAWSLRQSAGNSGCCGSPAPASADSCCCGSDPAPAPADSCCCGDPVPADCCCSDPAPVESCCCGASATSDAARNTVSRLWSAVSPAPDPVSGKNMKLDSLDAFIREAERRERETLAISGMAFQDAWTVDLARLARCYIHVVSPGGELIPFCSYNLTSQGGRPLHRGVK